MPTPTYDLISSTTLAAATSSVTFSGFPTDGTYRDLVLVVDGTGTGATNLGLRFNSDSGSNYTYVDMYGNGSTATSGSGTSTFAYAGVSYTNQGMNIVQIMDYSATDKHKALLARGSTAGNLVIAYASRWASTSAISSIVAFPNGASFSSGSTFNLYGIAS